MITLPGLVRAVALAVALAGCRSEPLPILGTLPPFVLTDHTGIEVTNASLAGSVWIADFVFTHCPDVCPALTSRMAGLQQQLAVGADPIRLVSISVDPERDTPGVLAGYAERAGARTGWRFLTGDHDAVAALLRDGFHVAWATDGPPASPITHSDRFVLVDRAGRIRGYYHGTDPDDVQRLTRDALALRGERVG